MPISSSGWNPITVDDPRVGRFLVGRRFMSVTSPRRLKESFATRKPFREPALARFSPRHYFAKVSLSGVSRSDDPRSAPSPTNKLRFLKTFADQAVIAIENVRLFKELDERTNELTRSVGELQALGEVGQAVSSTLDLETVLTRHRFPRVLRRYRRRGDLRI